MNLKSKYGIKISRVVVVGLLTMLAILVPVKNRAQNYPSRNYTMSDGLPSMGIRCIYKDSRGLLWIGTDAGLCTFDGRSFRILKPSEGMTASQVWAIAEDEAGNLWFGSHGDGLYKYDGIHFERFTKKDGMLDNSIRVLRYSRQYHCLIAGSAQGISTIRGNNITNSRGKGLLIEKVFGTVTGIEDAGKFLYITTYSQNSPIRYYPGEEKFISVHDNGVKYPSHSFSAFITSKGDSIFSLTTRGIRIIKKDGGFQDEYTGQVFGMTEDKRGDIWIASWQLPGMDYEGGIYRYDGRDVKNFKSSFGIHDNEVWTVYYDQEQDILWIGTLNEGLFMVPFNYITNYPGSYFGLEDQHIFDLFVDSADRLWISGSRELITMKPDGEFSFMEKHPMMMAYRSYWNDPRQLPYPEVMSKRLAPSKITLEQLQKLVVEKDFNFMKVLEDNDGSILFTNEFGLFRYNEPMRKTEYLGIEGETFDLAVMGDTLIYSCSESTMMNPRFRNRPIGLKNNWNFPRSLFFPFDRKYSPRGVTRLVRHGNTYWYTSSSSGLWMSRGLNLTHFNETDSTISKNLNDVCFDEKGHVIFGSNSGEICIATFINDHLTIDYRINNDNGLRGNSITWLIADRKGKLWAGTNRGLNIIDLDEIYKNGNCEVRFIDGEEGYSGHSSKHAVLDSSGNLWIGARNQLIRLNTNGFLSSRNDTLRVILKSFVINQVPSDNIPGIRTDSWTRLPVGKIGLKYSENNLVFNFDILNYHNTDKDKFQYMLKGYDKTWSKGTAGRRAVYTNLPAGNYTFCVESVNLGTNREAKPLIFEFSIQSPWWVQWHLNVLGITLLLLLTIVITRHFNEARRKKQLERSEIERKIAELEMMALQAQMNPHFIFNCISGIQYFILAKKNDDVLNYLSDFSKVVRESLANATVRMIPLQQEISFLNSYLRLEKMRFPDKIDYSINCQGNLNEGFILLPPMLIQPFVENSIRHGFHSLQGKGRISVVFEIYEKDVLKCTISDNGSGRVTVPETSHSDHKPDRLHGTVITENRIRLFNTPGTPEKYRVVYTDLRVEGNPRGLKVELFVPSGVARD